MNKAFLALGVAGVLTYSVPAMPVKAVNNSRISTYSDEIQPYTAGLISRYSLSATSSNGNLCLNGYTLSNSKMKSIGFKNIVVQRSSDGVNWEKEKNLSDILKSDYEYYLDDYSVNVQGGYYYRVTCTHYAKESGLFGSSQSVNNTSNSVWID